MAAAYHLLLLLPFILLFPATHSHNITALLDAFPDYSLYNSFLSQTKVSDEINSHVQVTCLVLPNSAMSALVARHGLPAIKNVLRLLSLLKYFDPHRPRYLPAGAAGTTVSATLYQLTVTGAVPARSQGYIKITYRLGGGITFASARPGLAFHATYTKSVQQIPCSLSVLEVSPPAVFPEFIINPPPAPSNLTAFLEDAGCKIFASLITSSGVLRTYQSVMGNGFTLFAPTDDAFKADGAPDLTALSRTDLVTVLQYHALPSYTPKASLKTSWGPIATMASTGNSGMYNLSVSSDGDDVSLNTGVGAARVTSTLLDSAPVCVIVVDSLLLPHELPSAALAPFASSFLHLAPMLAPSVALVPAADSPDDTSYPVQPINRTPRTPRIRSPPPPRIQSPPPPRAMPPPPPGPDTPDTPDTPEVPDVVPYIPTHDAPPPHVNAAANISVPDPRRLAKTACAFFVLYFVIIDRYFY